MTSPSLEQALTSRNVEALCTTINATPSPVLPEITRDLLQDAVEKDLWELLERFKNVHGYSDLATLQLPLPDRGDEYTISLKPSPVQEHDFAPETSRDWFGINKICDCTVTRDESIFQKNLVERERAMLEGLQESFPDIEIEELQELVEISRRRELSSDRAIYGEDVFVSRPQGSMMVLLRTVVTEDGEQDSLLMVRQPEFCYSYHISKGLIEIDFGEDEYEREATDADLYILRECLDDLLKVAERHI
jgi:hypothetical protein